MKLNTLYLFLLLTLFYGCKKDGVTTPAVKTTSVQVDKNNNIATANGEVTSEGASAVTKRGFVWSTVANPTVSDALSSNQFGPGVFTQQISGLNLGATYYLRAYATNANGTTYGNQIDFKTLTAGKFASISFDSLSFKSVKVNVNIESLGDISIKSIGVCYSKTGTPSITSDTMTILHSNITDKSFSVSVRNLTVNTKYFIRSFINTNLGAFYSDEINVTTKQYTQGTFGDVVITSLSNLSADAKVNISTLGDAPIKSMGLCFATTNDPVFKTDSSTLIHSNKTDQIFTLALRNIKENTKYYVRAFINSDAGIAYSNSFFFTTLGRPTFGLVPYFTGPIPRTTATVFSYGGSENGAQVTEYGFMIGADKFISSNINGAFNVNNFYSYDLKGLTGNTTYTATSFATNKYGTGYSKSSEFLTGPTEPVINTASVTDIFGTNAISAVLVTSNGGAEITELGLVLSTKSNPTISDRFYVGVSSSAKILLSKLTYDSTYYIRAYAKNKVGITYGNEVNFTTVYRVGETGPAGGIIFYDQGSKKNGWRYMETTLKDIDVVAPGGCYNTVNINTDSAMGAGLENTNKIIELCSESGISARVAKSFTLNNYKDWFLPSFYELKAIFNSNPSSSSPSKAQYVQFVQQGKIGYGYQTSTFQGIGSQANMIFANYWEQIWTNSGRKDDHYVRPVRRFQ
jgi:hypothetical protein